MGGAAGGIGYHDERFIEYDLDKEDEEWLEAFNRGQEDRLPARRMELLMWRLECANAEATDSALAAAGERLILPATCLIYWGRPLHHAVTYFSIGKSGWYGATGGLSHGQLCMLQCRRCAD